jgi:hypothetical protein
MSGSIPCAPVALPSSYDEFFDRLSHGLKGHIRRYGEHLQTDHQVRFETASSDPSGELVTALLRLHEARWQTKDEQGMLAGRDRFFRAVTPTLAGSNLLRIHVLEADGQIAGIVYQLWDGCRAYGYIPDGTITLEVFSLDRHYFQYSSEVLRRIWDEVSNAAPSTGPSPETYDT